ncbi:MAG: hypothetical protein HN658_07370 [Rhodospirillales bacterium]|jgi:hypothetical protein|nr:hypothetical protein [Rhodospirillales bacterium]MBT4007578.1 hypothetical protein [Rhodospirillales bacterium]MBT5076203.1 hypothetical protein [Rhodospirillales bacterium]MBT5113292.1 hypothetical protein [Rhodospirillales bacterium]MBT5671925.1 hypothetical protein [Rhodospirillales bacterium]
MSETRDMAVKALTQIESHERICAARWTTVRNVMVVILFKMGALIGILIWKLVLD